MMVGKVRKLANPRRPAAKKNKAVKRRKLSAKQVKHFGTKAQKSALKRSRAAKRAAPKRKANSSKRHQFWEAALKTPSLRKRILATTSKPKKRRKNPLQMVTLGLINPHRKVKGSMATKTKRKTAKRNPARKATTRRRKNTRIIVMGAPRRKRRATRSKANGTTRRRAVHHKRRSSRNPALLGVHGGKAVGELLLGGLGGVALGKATPGFLPAALVSNPLFAAVSVAAVGWGAGMAISRFLGKNVGDGVTFGAWMEAGGQLISAYLPSLNLGLGQFVPASFNEPDNPIMAARQRMLIAQAAAPMPATVGMGSAYARAY